MQDRDRHLGQEVCYNSALADCKRAYGFNLEDALGQLLEAMSPSPESRCLPLSLHVTLASGALELCRFRSKVLVISARCIGVAGPRGLELREWPPGEATMRVAVVVVRLPAVRARSTALRARLAAGLVDASLRTEGLRVRFPVAVTPAETLLGIVTEGEVMTEELIARQVPTGAWPGGD